MRHYIGIDLGTTNSAICSFDGKETYIWKSPEQADVTPSAIYVDRKGHYFYGRKALSLAAGKEKNSATLFKRYLGTSKNYVLEDAGITLTPVECSAQLLKVLFGYLPEEVRNDPDTVTVITVPAAFNQMKKDATLEAARLAGLGQTALMQEPVAAVMSVLKKDRQESRFLIYDLGGGTFDVSVARIVESHVSLLAQGGKEMCGGRDMDRWLYTHTILPWLRKHFHLPADPDGQEKYLAMKRAILFAVEEAKIALSAQDSAAIWIDEDTLKTADEAGDPIYVDLTITRDDLREIVADMAKETAELARETLNRAGLNTEDVDRIVFIGGPTMYAPLREEVQRLLEIPSGTTVNPMTAVAEGAAIYAETINWEDPRHTRKESFDEIPEEEKIRIRYEKRTAAATSKIAVLVADSELRIARVVSNGMDADAEDNTGSPSQPYDSGRVNIVRQGILEVPLPKPGTYDFVLTVCDEQDQPCLPPQHIRITRTLASIESIPASHSIMIKALDRPGGRSVALYLTEANDPLPKTGQLTVHAAQQLIGQSEDALTFSLWEGEIPDPIDDNRYIGTYRIPGSAFSGGTIPVGADIICDYEINEAGNLRLGVSVPCVGLQMANQNFYSRKEGQLNLQDTWNLTREIRSLLDRTAQMQMRIVDEELTSVRKTLMDLHSTLKHSGDSEQVALAESTLMDCYRRVGLLHQRYANVIKNGDLESVLSRFESVRKQATPDEIASIQNLADLARHAIHQGSSDFDELLDEMRHQIFSIQWKQDSYVRNLFSSITKYPGDYSDRAAFDRLQAEGLTCLENGDMDTLREVIVRLSDIKNAAKPLSVEKMMEEVSIYQ